MKASVLICLLAATSAIHVKDLGDLDLPVIKDENELLFDKEIESQKSKYQGLAQNDMSAIEGFEKQLDQGLRNANQGEMGRALAVSKLAAIKDTVNSLSQNIEGEATSLRAQVDKMMQKKLPAEVDESAIKSMENKGIEITSQIPKINQLEQTLEIQEEDEELMKIKGKIDKTIEGTKTYVQMGN